MLQIKIFIFSLFIILSSAVGLAQRSSSALTPADALANQLTNEKFNYFQKLGLSPDASVEQIQKKCQELFEKYHPDANASSSLARQKISSYVTNELQRISEALSSEAKVQEYISKTKVEIKPPAPTALMETKPTALVDPEKVAKKSVAPGSQNPALSKTAARAYQAAGAVCQKNIAQRIIDMAR